MKSLGALLAFVGVAACASSGASHPASRGTVTQWSGTFRANNSSNNGTLMPSSTYRGAGTITLTAIGGTPPATRVEVSINGATPDVQLGWGIFAGGCGSPAPMVTGQNQFPAIQVSSSGDGHVRTDISFALDPNSSYHANVYPTVSANDPSSVMMCAKLSPQ